MGECGNPSRPTWCAADGSSERRIRVHRSPRAREEPQPEPENGKAQVKSEIQFWNLASLKVDPINVDVLNFNSKSQPVFLTRNLIEKSNIGLLNGYTLFCVLVMAVTKEDILHLFLNGCTIDKIAEQLTLTAFHCLDDRAKQETNRLIKRGYGPETPVTWEAINWETNPRK
jgi:hypothetical protein